MELPIWKPVSGGRRASYKLETKNVSYKLGSSKCEEWFSSFYSGRTRDRTSKLVLEDVTFEARPGEVTAIAGPSGAGKTTLIEILAGKILPEEASGQVLVNGRPLDARNFRRVSGYVTQEDALFPLLTVQETLVYSALLRLPGGKKEVGSRVRALIKELGLELVADCRIGEGQNGGISGGERRRVSIGVDLVHDPAVIFIDEPTSGLDSASALHLVSLLKSMAVNQGKTVVFTIHQPNFRILELLDRVFLLWSGTVVHNGPLGLLEERLQHAGHHIPRRVNVLEFAIDAVESLALPCPNPSNNQRRRIKGKAGLVVADEKRPLPFPNSRFEEVLILGERFCSNIFRTNQLFATRVIQVVVAGLILGTVYLNVGKDIEKVGLQTRIGLFAFSLTFLLSSSTEGLPIFLQERRILMRETSRGAYRVSSYVLANTLVFIPFLLMISLLFSTPVYWLVGLGGGISGFSYFCLVVWLVLLMSNSFVACFSALVPNFIMGNSVIAGLIGSFFLFSGYFISKHEIPNYWLFMHYLSLFKYPFECLLINEFGGDESRKRCIEFEGGQCSSYGSDFLKQQSLIQSQKWSNLAVMLGFILGYRLLCFLILSFRCYRTRY